MLGQLTLDEEHARVAEAKAWLMKHAGEQRAFAMYLERWGDWADPRTGKGMVSEAEMQTAKPR
jgi:hypothetical protein